MTSDREPGSERDDQVDRGAGVDLERRRFFRVFGRETVTAAGNVLGAANALRRGTSAAAGQLLTLGVGDPAANARRLDGSAGVEALPETLATFRSPYRLVDDRIRLLDQRRLPGLVVEVACRDADDVARAMRDGVVRGAPVLGQVAAYGLALTVANASASGSTRVSPVLHAAAADLRRAGSTARNVGWAVDRLIERWRADGADDGARDAIAGLRTEADAIATEAMLDHARLGRIGVGLMPRDTTRPLEILTHGNAGALAGGLVGTVLAVLQALVSEGRQVHVWITETRPRLEGSRLTAWELRQSDIAHTVIADGAAAWLLRDRTLDAVLVGAEWIVADGHTANVAGTFPLALAAQRSGVPFFVCAPMATMDDTDRAGAAIPVVVGPAPELVPADMPDHPVPVDTRHPECDVTPPDLVTAFITEEGVLRAPYGETLARARAERDARRLRATAVTTGPAHDGAPA